MNKKLQSKPPYSIIPLTYSNKNLLPIHFAYDPGPDYDWKKFPLRENDLKAKTRVNESNENMSVSSQNVQQQQQQSLLTDTIDLSLNEKMYLLQTYLDLVKLELYDPGPLLKRTCNNNVAINSSGMCASISNIYVNEPPKLELNTSNESKSKPYKSNTKQSVNNKLQKFLNIFKRDSNSYKNNLTENENDNKYTTTNSIINKNDSKSSFFSGKLRSSTRGSKNHQVTNCISSVEEPDDLDSAKPKSTTLPSKLKPTPTINNQNSVNTSKTINNQQIFHKVVRYKNWSALFESFVNRVCLLGVKLNLAKPPKYKIVISNYIESSLKRFEEAKIQQKNNHNQLTNSHQNRTDINNSHNNNNNNNNNNNDINYGSNLQRYKVSNEVSNGNYHCPYNKAECNQDNICSNCYSNTKNSRNLVTNMSVRGSVLSNSSNYNHYSYNTSNNRRSFGEQYSTNEVTSYFQL